MKFKKGKHTPAFFALLSVNRQLSLLHAHLFEIHFGGHSRSKSLGSDLAAIRDIEGQSGSEVFQIAFINGIVGTLGISGKRAGSWIVTTLGGNQSTIVEHGNCPVGGTVVRSAIAVKVNIHGVEARSHIGIFFVGDVFVVDVVDGATGIGVEIQMATVSAGSVAVVDVTVIEGILIAFFVHLLRLNHVEVNVLGIVERKADLEQTSAYFNQFDRFFSDFAHFAVAVQNGN